VAGAEAASSGPAACRVKCACCPHRFSRHVHRPGRRWLRHKARRAGRCSCPAAVSCLAGKLFFVRRCGASTAARRTEPGSPWTCLVEAEDSPSPGEVNSPARPPGTGRALRGGHRDRNSGRPEIHAATTFGVKLMPGEPRAAPRATRDSAKLPGKNFGRRAKTSPRLPSRLDPVCCLRCAAGQRRRGWLGGEITAAPGCSTISNEISGLFLHSSTSARCDVRPCEPSAPGAGHPSLAAPVPPLAALHAPLSQASYWPWPAWAKINLCRGTQRGRKGSPNLGAPLLICNGFTASSSLEAVDAADRCGSRRLPAGADRPQHGSAIAVGGPSMHGFGDDPVAVVLAARTSDPRRCPFSRAPSRPRAPRSGAWSPSAFVPTP